MFLIFAEYTIFTLFRLIPSIESRPYFSTAVSPIEKSTNHISPAKPPTTTASLTKTLHKDKPPKISNCNRMQLKLADPPHSIVGSFGQGRLGNQLSNFASCYALMKDYGMYHYLNSFQLRILQNVFVLPDSHGSDNSPYYIWDEGKCII